MARPERVRSQASVLALSVFASQIHTPPFVTCGDIFPRSGGSLSSKGEALAVHAKFAVLPKAPPLGELARKRLRGRILTLFIVTEPPAHFHRFCPFLRPQAGKSDTNPPQDLWKFCKKLFFCRQNVYNGWESIPVLRPEHPAGRFLWRYFF